MAMRIVSWVGNEHIVSPNPLNTPSIVSVDSILQDKPVTFPAVQGTPNAAQSRTTNMASQLVEPSRTRTWTSTSTYLGVDKADGQFVRHPKYFFKDGNIAFLVCVVRSCNWCETEFIDCTLRRLTTRCIVSTDISSRVIRYTSPPDSPSSTFMTTRLSQPPYP